MSVNNLSYHRVIYVHWLEERNQILTKNLEKNEDKKVHKMQEIIP